MWEEVAGFCFVKFPVSWTELWANTWVCSVRMVLFIILLHKQERGEWEMRKFGPVFVHLLGKGGSSFITCFVGEVLALLLFIPRARWCYEALRSHLIQNCERQTEQSHHPPPSQTLLLFIFRGVFCTQWTHLWTAIVFQGLFDE